MYFNFRSNCYPVMNEKLKKLDKIETSMMSGNHRQRPNCKEIIHSMEEWIFTQNEIKELKIFEEIERKFSNESENSKKFFITFLNRHKPKM